jgi:hypothetical protein
MCRTKFNINLLLKAFRSETYGLAQTSSLYVHLVTKKKRIDSNIPFRCYSQSKYKYLQEKKIIDILFVSSRN